jgi:DNA-directed RNA polymerase specialized sigma24 family protein
MGQRDQDPRLRRLRRHATPREGRLAPPRSARSADDAGEETGQLDRNVYKALEKQRLEQEADEQDADDDAQARGFLDWAVPQLSPKRRAVPCRAVPCRAVTELYGDDVPCEDIQQRLGVSRDVVYASRSRALKDLAKLREEYPA